MLGAIFLLFSFILGWLLVDWLLKPNNDLLKLAASFLVGILVASWAAWLVFGWGAVGFLIVLLAVGLIFWKRIKKTDFRVRITPSEFIFLVFCLVFSFWLMGKSFGYADDYFQIASNIYDDFNVHLSLIRSFSWGNNFPSQLPFFAGPPIRYHFMGDFSFAIFERLGWNPGWAVNIPSALAFSSLLILIYSLAQKIFSKGRLIGWLAVILFLFNSGLTWVKFLQKYGLNPGQVWQQGQYLSAGPFDGGIISIFWNLNTFVNQRHLIFALGVTLLAIFVVWQNWQSQKVQMKELIFAGILIGLLPLWHGLIFIAAIATIFCLWLISGLKKRFLWLFLAAAIFSLLQILFLSGGNLPQFRPGFLVADSLTAANFANYWVFNLGMSLITIPAGFLLANRRQKLFFLVALGSFLAANVFQFSRNLFHNHGLLNFWIILANFYTAYFLVWLGRKKLAGKIAAGILMFFLTLSGVIDLMVIKNDFIHKVADAPRSSLIDWISKQTATDAVFFGGPEIYHPANLVGRRVFLGAEHFVWGYGYPVDERKILTAKINEKNIEQTKADYWLTDKTVKINLPKVYEDENWTVYKIFSP